MASHPASRRWEALGGTERERDRYRALCLTVASLVLTLDRHDRVAEADGVIPGDEDQSPSILRGQQIDDLIAERETASSIRTALREWRAVSSQSATLRLSHGGTTRVVISARRIDDDQAVMAVQRRLSRTRRGDEEDGEAADPRSGLFSAEVFARVAEARLSQLQGPQAHGPRGNDIGHGYRLTTFAIDRLRELLERLDHRARRELIAVIGACLRANAVGGEIAGDLGDGKFALLHPVDVSVDRMKRRIETYARRLDPDHSGVAVQVADALADLSVLEEEEATTALIHAVKRLEAEARSHGPASDAVSRDLAVELPERLAHSIQRVTDIKETIRSGAFAVAVQPVVDIRGHQTHHYEALARLDAEDVTVSPFDFIREAEDFGAVRDFDLAMCKRVLRLLEDPQAANALGGRAVAVNLSGLSLSTPAFVEALESLLAAHAPARARLMIEITESFKIDDFAMARNVINGLRAAGHSICLDDFGSGMMHIDYLRALDVDFVKIDGSYVRSIMAREEDRVFLRAIAALCDALDLRTIAEMVESESQVPYLDDCGIKLVQGFLFGRPMIVLDANGRVTAAAAYP